MIAVRLRYVLAVAGGLAIATPALGGLMDESDCKYGFGSGYDLADAINKVGKRLVACVNYMQDEEIENHNDQQKLLRDLAQQLQDLEFRVSELERTR